MTSHPSAPAASPAVSVALDARAALGEGPRWHAAERQLYWVDILRNELHRFDPETGADEMRAFAQPVGCFAFRAAGGLLLAMKDGLAILADWGSEPQPFGDQILAGKPDLRFNDGRTDSAGRFWVGSVNMAKSAHDAALYRVGTDGTIDLIEGGMLTCNAAAFNASGTTFCHADTPSHALRAYDADVQRGTLSNRRILHQFEHGTGRPDGGSFDAEGCYWSALFEGGRVVRLSPEGELLQTVTLPVSRPTMIAFGGEDRRTAYVTTARAGLDEAALGREPHAGAIFSFPVDVPGLPEAPFGG
ncbi:sugar lactone lactonase YvrE [Sphingobium sp. B7D2B]|uniref:SMP-30/gluconolactonase/LRE family protein n=1 Tax=unclassified Sphingobium TaxID=2611147 RepID=UPI00222452CD|nr:MULTISPECIES: SMP-30/gluconolactonase/LRE family protein [unclassified Sphingobium]MCW2367795.1 sugar lactone lactonase YvrE [Sphingobium sp. B7D2B]MCW2368096.1 sugar lactone lactonase YvrE [Sphingobium sp. B11D3D]